MSQGDGMFDRLAGQPTEPTSDPGAIIESAKDSFRGETGIGVGEVTLSGVRPMPVTPRPRYDLVAYGIAAAIALVLIAVVFTWTLPLKSELQVVRLDLADAQQKLAAQSLEISRLTRERDDLEKARSALASENEQTATAVDARRRDAETQDALTSRAKLTAKKPKKPTKKPKKR